MFEQVIYLVQGFFRQCLRLEEIEPKKQNRKEKFAEYIHFRGVDYWKSKYKRKNVCCLWKSQWKTFGVLTKLPGSKLKLTISRCGTRCG